MKGLATLACLTAILTLAACLDTPPEAAPGIEVTVKDSTGVRHTTSRGDPVPWAILDSVPLLPLGENVDGSPTSFAGVQGVLRDGIGRIWVADGQANELRIFGPDGGHVATRGGRGEGPGEFQQLLLLGTLPGDTVLTGDRVLPRITAWGPDADFAWTRTFTPSEAAPPRPFAPFPDGSVLAMARTSLSGAGLAEGELIRENNALLRITPEGSAVEVGIAPGATWVWTGSGMVPLPFTAPASFAVVGDALHVVSGPGPLVHVYRNGGLTSMYGLDEAPRAVGAGELAAYRGFVERWIPEGMRLDYEEPLGHPELPQVLPTWDRLLPGPGGTAWLRRYAIDPLAPRDWDVFGPDGAWRGQVHVDGGFEPFQVSDNALMGVWRSDLGVEEVREYRLRPWL